MLSGRQGCQKSDIMPFWLSTQTVLGTVSHLQVQPAGEDTCNA